MCIIVSFLLWLSQNVDSVKIIDIVLYCITRKDTTLKYLTRTALPSPLVLI